jgi:hypothetical protein
MQGAKALGLATACSARLKQAAEKRAVFIRVDGERAFQGSIVPILFSRQLHFAAAEGLL